MLVQRSAVYLGQVSQVCATRGSYIKLHRYARHKAALHICTRWRMGGTSTAKVPSMFSVCSVYVPCMSCAEKYRYVSCPILFIIIMRKISSLTTAPKLFT